MNKLDVRRMQMLSRQRQKLEEEAAALQAEVDAMVGSRLASCSSCLIVVVVQELAAMKK